MNTDLALVLIVVAFYFGWKISQAWHLHSFREILADLGIDRKKLLGLMEDKGIEPDEPIDENADLPVLEVRIEQQPEGLFAYRKDNSLFIARGKDRTELMENLIDNLSNVRVVIAKEDGADLIKE